MTEHELRTTVVNAAETLVRMGAQAAHQLVVETYNGQNPLPQGYRLRETDAWCAAFVSTVAIRTGLTDILPTECSCPRMIASYQARGRWMEDDAYCPQPGDLLLYDWQDNGHGDNLGLVDHIGIVAEVRDGLLDIIEGNYNGGVGHRKVAVNGRYIRGYCLPDYTAAAQKQAEPSGRFYTDTVGHWAEKSIDRCAELGLLRGRQEGLFDPDAPMTRAEMAAVLVRLLEEVG